MSGKRVGPRRAGSPRITLVLGAAAALSLFATGLGGTRIPARASIQVDCTAGPATARRAVQFVDALHGWSVGPGCPGPVRVTSDGGSSWTSQAVPDAGYSLTAVHFVDTSHGWAVGGAGGVRTVNGGSTWTALTLPAGFTATSTWFTDSNTGWVTGSSSGQPEVLKTGDGGGTWQVEVVPNPNYGYSLNSVAFVTASEGWAGGQGIGNTSDGTILHTADGGAHWSAQAVPTGDVIGNASVIYGLAFADSLHGVAVGGDTVYQDGVILNTSDGGATWVARDNNGPCAGTPCAVELAGVSFPDPLNAWAVGTNTTPGLGQVIVFHSSDGGTTWAPQAIPAGATRLDGVSFPTALTGWAVGADACNEAFVMQTTDGGAHWTIQDAPAPEAPSRFSGITAPSAADAFAVGNDDCGRGVVAATTDGGTTWSATAAPAGAGPLDSADFLTPLNGWVAGRGLAKVSGNVEVGAIFDTHDGGQTWHAETLPAGTEVITQVDFTDPLNGWASEEQASYTTACGGMLHTSDGGTTWVQQAMPPNVCAIPSVHFVDALHGWAVDNGGHEVVTSNGGSTWTLQQTFSFGPAPIADTITFTGLSAGLMGGSNNFPGPYIMRTTDGGASWSASSAPTGLGEVDAIAMSDASRGYAVAPAVGSPLPAVVLTTDGGASWSNLEVPCSGDLRSVAVSGSAVIAVGNDTASGPTRVSRGVILESSDAGATWKRLAFNSGLTANPVDSSNCASPPPSPSPGASPSPSPGAPASILVGAPTNASAGTPFSVSATVRDGNGATATGYRGTVHFSSTDPQAVLPADYAYQAADLGTKSFSVTLKSAGTRSITVTDTQSPAVNGSASVGVAAGSVDHLVLSPSLVSIPAGNSQVFVADARDAYGNDLGDVTSSTTFTVAPQGACSGSKCQVGIAGNHVVTGSYLGKTGTAQVSVTPSGYVLDGYGGLHQFGGAPPYGDSSHAYWGGWDIARSLAVRSDGRSGYTLDGYGGVHTFGGAPAIADGSHAYWSGWDIARGVAVRPDGGSGYILDGYGGLHGFGGAANPAATAYWSGWDIARSISLDPTDSSGARGYVLDGFGGIHAFGGASPVYDNTHAYWAGWDIARGIVTTGNGQGYVLDGYGGVHPFGGLASAAVSGYRTDGTFKALTYSAAYHGGYTVDAYGKVYAYSTDRFVPAEAPSATWPGWNIVRRIGSAG